MIEKYSFYEFEIIKHEPDEHCDHIHFIYQIFSNCKTQNYDSCTSILRESKEWYETEQEARFAAIGHINLLESGKD